MNTKTKDLIRKALDTLAMALVEKDHKWTKEQSRLFNAAIKALDQSTDDKNQ